MNELVAVQIAINGTDNGESYSATTVQGCLIAINFAAVW